MLWIQEIWLAAVPPVIEKKPLQDMLVAGMTVPHSKE